MHYLYINQSFRADGCLSLTRILSKVETVNRDAGALKAQHKKRLENYQSAEDIDTTIQYPTACVRDCLEDKSSIIINEATTIVGDEGYLFTIPSTVHRMANRYNTPFIAIIHNTCGWRAPKESTLALYLNGRASIATAADLQVHCGKVAWAAGNAVGIKAETAEEIVPALDAAVNSGRQALCLVA
jgi:Thiamine pyrophosphate enzyme, C-terminal TPP binding domain